MSAVSAAPRTLSQTYRPDIDGLRAIAVLSVVLYHIGGFRITGGFVGVDIFFVISGYLVGSHVLLDVRAGSFSLLSFYEKRTRRIFPALAALLLAVLSLSLLLDFPVETLRVGYSALSALFFGSNIYFWLHAGYFAPASGALPLLHTWSLGVEEQFYISLPIVIWLANRFCGRTGVRPVLIAIAGVSVLGSVAGVLYAPTATFYLLPTRAWELLCGTLLADGVLPVPSTAARRNMCSAAGLVLILAPILLFSSSTPFPGLGALAPCAGALLIIAAGVTGPSAVGKLLSLRPVVFLGLISYSLYLWHWPLLVYQNTTGFLYHGQSRMIIRMVILVASLLAATASWAVIERPFRMRRYFDARSIWASFAVGSVVVIVAGASTVVFGGFPGRFASGPLRLAAYMDYDANPAYRSGACFITSAYTFKDYRPAVCLTPRPGTKSVLLVGDSHAADLWPGLNEALAGVSVLQATVSGCTPTIVRPRGATAACSQMMRFVFKDLLSSRGLERIVMSGQWRPRDLPAFVSTLRWAKARNLPVVVIGPAPEYELPLPRLLAVSAIRNADPRAVSRYIDPELAPLDRKLKAAAAATGTPYVSLLDMLCPGGVCRTFAAPGVPLQFDSDHFTTPGSMVVAQTIGPVIMASH